jgi:hypothetical protein
MKCLEIKFSTSDYANGIHMKLQDEFLEAFKLKKAPEGMVMFSSKGRLEDKSIYLTPVNDDLLIAIGRAYNASQSILPPADTLSLLVGHSSSIDSLA